MSVTIYHNPRCSKSRQTLQLLQDRGIDPEIVAYLDTPPDAAEIKRLLGLLGIGARDVMRKKEAAYKDSGAGDPELDEDALIARIAANPILLERPIVVSGDRAAIGRPPEKVLEIL